jgi:predicted lipoprotein
MREKKMKILRYIIFASIIIASLALAWTYGFTVVEIREMEEVVQSEAFNEVIFVDNIWENQILSTINQNAVDLALILSAMDVDSSGIASKETLVEVAEEYGLITVGEAHVYMVKGQGTVISVNSSGSIGTIEINLNGYDGSVQVLIFIGPRIPSDNSAIRDSVGFITFGDFREQTQYGKVASELNRRVITDVLEPLDIESLLGQQIYFEGAFAIRTFNLINIDLSKINIVPVKIEVLEQ